MLQGVLGSLQGLSKSWTGANAKDGDKEKERRKEKDKEIQNSWSEKDRNIGSYRSDSIPSTSSGATDVSYGRATDSSSVVPYVLDSMNKMQLLQLDYAHSRIARVLVDNFFFLSDLIIEPHLVIRLLII
jgi:hypothetical protein